MLYTFLFLFPLSFALEVLLVVVFEIVVGHRGLLFISGVDDVCLDGAIVGGAHLEA